VRKKFAATHGGWVRKLLTAVELCNVEPFLGAGCLGEGPNHALGIGRFGDTL
jgi:hypothetical protein